MKRRYRALRVIGSIYKVLGIIVGVITLLSIVGFCLSALTGATALVSLGEELGVSREYAIIFGAIGSGVVFIYGVAVTLTFYAFGEGLQVMVSMAKDARETVTLLREREEVESTEDEA